MGLTDYFLCPKEMNFELIGGSSSTLQTQFQIAVEACSQKNLDKKGKNEKCMNKTVIEETLNHL